ncbi:hypothetical protein BO78DRAFT_399070 [Aspergillus sclerotiicarbonarius CBS 121057]|uniref:Uncharacterized protein n=1 Tax=Aspergillus sclerotiicarbonarius (strain CBS 121057 / IBT 28362) TaxID=1448318 RepID=A0A319ET14_ASPSB|nr:hypothetical protein BO78DRAFT_399070 [Aspergillus sclerotiicarbonarius CBS 121057]
MDALVLQWLCLLYGLPNDGGVSVKYRALALGMGIGIGNADLSTSGGIWNSKRD